MGAEISFRTASRRRTRAASAFGALALLAATGCAGFQQGSYRDLQRDWERAGSSARATPGEDPFAGYAALERGALVELVLERNPTLRAARWAWRAALERHPQVVSLDDPMLGLTAAPRSFGSSQVDDATIVELSQRLPFPGKLALRGEAALAEAEAAGADHATVRLGLATLASLLFDELYLAERSLEINAEHVELLQEFQRIATARYEAGEASQQDPIQAEVELARAQQRDVVLATRRRVVAQQINALLHRAPERPLPPPPARLEAPEVHALEVEALVAEALRERPELRASEARIRARGADVALARREFLPDFTVSGGYNEVMQERDLHPMVGLSLNIPLRLDRRRAALEEARAGLERARSERAAAEDDVRLGVQSGLDRLREARQVLALFEDRILPAARDQVDAARAGFETGRNSFLALIDAERSLRDVELGLEEARTDVTRRRAELDRAIGRVPGVSWGGIAP